MLTGAVFLISQRGTRFLKKESDSAWLAKDLYARGLRNREMNRKQQRALKSLLWILGLSLAANIVGRPLYWQLIDGFSAVRHHVSPSSCPPCHCDCSLEPLITLPEGNFSFLSFIKKKIPLEKIIIIKRRRIRRKSIRICIFCFSIVVFLL